MGLDPVDDMEFIYVRHGILVGLGSHDSIPSIWFSSDAAAWQRVDLGDALTAAGRTVAIAHVPGRVVVAGEEGRGPDVRPVFWIAPDLPGPWRRVGTLDSVFPDGSRVVALANSDDGFIAAGAVFADLTDQSTASVAVWTSVDGAVWTSAAGVLSGVPGSLVTASSDGEAYVLGGTAKVGGGTDALLIVQGGSAWEVVRASGLDGPEDEWVTSVVHNRGRAIAFGGWSAAACRQIQACEETGARLWVSDGGPHWTAIDSAAAPFAVSNGLGGLIGLDWGRGDATSDLRVVRSDDGAAFQPVGPPVPLRGREVPLSLAAIGERLVVLVQERSKIAFWMIDL